MDAQRSRRRLEEEVTRLHAVRAGLERDHPHDSDAERSSELSSVDQHQADVASEVLEHEVELAIAASLDARLKEAADALGRLDRGEYGTCQACGRPIADDRLDAMPATRFCIDDEHLQEGRGTFTGGAASAGHIAAREASEHLEFLPTDDETDEDLDLGPEELALHRISALGEPYTALSPEDLQASAPIAHSR